MCPASRLDASYEGNRFRAQALCDDTVRLASSFTGKFIKATLDDFLLDEADPLLQAAYEELRDRKEFLRSKGSKLAENEQSWSRGGHQACLVFASVFACECVSSQSLVDAIISISLCTFRLAVNLEHAERKGRMHFRGHKA